MIREPLNRNKKLFQQHDLGKDKHIIIDANISKFMKAKKVLDFRSISS